MILASSSGSSTQIDSMRSTNASACSSRPVSTSRAKYSQKSGGLASRTSSGRASNQLPSVATSPACAYRGATSTRRSPAVSQSRAAKAWSIASAGKPLARYQALARRCSSATAFSSATLVNWWRSRSANRCSYRYHSLDSSRGTRSRLARSRAGSRVRLSVRPVTLADMTESSREPPAASARRRRPGFDARHGPRALPAGRGSGLYPAGGPGRRMAMLAVWPCRKQRSPTGPISPAQNIPAAGTPPSAACSGAMSPSGAP